MIARHGPVVTWLLTGCALLFALVTVGGITRLTGSGLSITEWNVLMGILPPLNHDAWVELFRKYQATPQFQTVNSHFGLIDFQRIFWWEYIHRLLARAIGLVFLVPLLWLVATRRVEGRLVLRLLAVLVLGGLQGVLGWLMVASGLVDNPAVSHYRLAAHLLTAFATYGLALWIALDLLRGLERPRVRVRGWVAVATWTVAVLVVLQISYGAFVAGLRAGFLFNTFPTMGGHWIPPGMDALHPTIRNLVENRVTVQFIHRAIGWILLIAVGAYWLAVRGRPALGPAPGFLLTSVALQFVLGIVAILQLPRHPVLTGALHQAGGLLVFSALVCLLFVVRRGNPFTMWPAPG